MANETMICKLALSELEIGQLIESLDEPTQAARTCSLWFEQCRDEVLEDFPWDFAYASTALAAVSDQTFPGWTYVYQYPTNCLRVLQVGPESGMRLSALNAFYVPPYENQIPAPFRFPWRLALKNDGASKVILTDLPQAYAYYTQRVTNAAVFSPSFVAMLALKLASKIGKPLKADAQRVALVLQQYEYKRSQAQAIALNQAQEEPRMDSPSILARG